MEGGQLGVEEVGAVVVGGRGASVATVATYHVEYIHGHSTVLEMFFVLLKGATIVPNRKNRAR